MYSALMTKRLKKHTMQNRALNSDLDKQERSASITRSSGHNEAKTSARLNVLENN